MLRELLSVTSRTYLVLRVQMYARRPGKICAIRAFVPNASDGSGSTLDEMEIRYASLQYREVYCVRVDRQLVLCADREVAMFRLFTFYNWRTYILRACYYHWHLNASTMRSRG